MFYKLQFETGNGNVITNMGSISQTYYAPFTRADPKREKKRLTA